MIDSLPNGPSPSEDGPTAPVEGSEPGELADADAPAAQVEGSEPGELADADARAAQVEASEPAGVQAGTEDPLVDGPDSFALEVVPAGEPASPLEFVDVVLALPSSSPVVILREVDWPERELHIPVGMAEGVAIGYAARHIQTPKPLTHALFVDALVAFGLAVEVVRITDVAGRAYFAEVVFSGPGGTRVLACRPSDGICLALRSLLPVPITATARVLEAVGIQPD